MQHLAWHIRASCQTQAYNENNWSHILIQKTATVSLFDFCLFVILVSCCCCVCVCFCFVFVFSKLWKMFSAKVSLFVCLFCFIFIFIIYCCARCDATSCGTKLFISDIISIVFKDKNHLFHWPVHIIYMYTFNIIPTVL